MKRLLILVLMCAACSRFEMYSAACAKACAPQAVATFVNTNPEVCVCQAAPRAP